MMMQDERLACESCLFQGLSTFPTHTRFPPCALGAQIGNQHRTAVPCAVLRVGAACVACPGPILGGADSTLKLFHPFTLHT